MKLDVERPLRPDREEVGEARFDMKLVNPANKRKYTVIMVGSGLAGAGGAAVDGGARLPRQVLLLPGLAAPRALDRGAGRHQRREELPQRRRLASPALLRHVKGGDFRAREANVYRLAQVSVNIIDQCVAQGVPFAREYGGLLDNRSFGGAQVSRTFYARGQTGQQLLLGAYQALERQIGLAGRDVSRARDAGARRRRPGARHRRPRHGHRRDRDAPRRRRVPGTGGYGNVFYLATYAKGCNATAIWRAYKKGAAFANPCFTQIHPTCIPVTGDYQSKLT
jgi:succinate dehydrogenase / fumarate reductase flavoprotein subunit